jgi:hypothetical protein
MKGKDTERLAGVLAQCPALAYLDLSATSFVEAAGAERLTGVLGQCAALAHLDLVRIFPLRRGTIPKSAWKIFTLFHTISRHEARKPQTRREVRRELGEWGGGE